MEKIGSDICQLIVDMIGIENALPLRSVCKLWNCYIDHDLNPWWTTRIVHLLRSLQYSRRSIAAQKQSPSRSQFSQSNTPYLPYLVTISKLYQTQNNQAIECAVWDQEIRSEKVQRMLELLLPFAFVVSSDFQYYRGSNSEVFRSLKCSLFHVGGKPTHVQLDMSICNYWYKTSHITLAGYSKSGNYILEEWHGQRITEVDSQSQINISDIRCLSAIMKYLGFPQDLYSDPVCVWEFPYTIYESLNIKCCGATGFNNSFEIWNISKQDLIGEFKDAFKLITINDTPLFQMNTDNVA